MDRGIQKCDSITYSPSALSTINTPNSQTNINTIRGDSVNSFIFSLRRLIFDVIHAANNNRYKDGDVILLVGLGPIVLFKVYKLASGSSKLIEETINAHIVCLLYKLTTSAKKMMFCQLVLIAIMKRGKES